jgi:hypothetical protein
VARRKNADSKINTEGWMMSYADMATILLAMFIVLSTLGKDQTGASLQKGLESWRESRQFFGLDGMFKESGQVAQLGAPGPHYPFPPDDDNDGDPSQDGETARLERFLDQMSRQFDLDKLPKAAGQATVDFFDPLHSQAPLLTAKHIERLSPVLRLLHRPEYRATLVVWATMPSDPAWTRAAEQAAELSHELLDLANLDPAARSHLLAVGQSWRYRNYQRPVFSLVITRLEK